MMRANSNGTALERFVEDKLIAHGYLKIEDSAWFFKHYQDKDFPQGNYYAKEVFVGEGAIKGKKRRVEFFLVGRTTFPHGHLIECKWQEVSGSAEDKLFRLPQDIQKTGIPTTVILDGPGFSSGIISYLKSQVDGRAFCAMYSMKEFQVAVNRGILSSGVIVPVIVSRKTQRTQPISLWPEVPV